MLILGLDVSTSVVGVSIVDDTIEPDKNGSNIVYLDRVEFKGCKTLWEKADAMSVAFINLRRSMIGRDEGQFENIRVVDRVVLEEALLGFRPGMSSAMTISTLMRFNGIVSFLARNIFQCEPEYIGSAHARKLCGIKLQRTAAGGPQKEQVFAHMQKNDLQHAVWPKKKNGVDDVDWSRDATDAYVIARAAAVAGPIQPPTKKAKKPKKNP
jgi:hypothetical protein